MTRLRLYLIIIFFCYDKFYLLLLLLKIVDFYKFTSISTQVVVKRFTSTSTQVQNKTSSLNPAYILIDLTARDECAIGIGIKQLKARMR